MSKTDKKIERRNGVRTHYAVVKAPFSGSHYRKHKGNHGMKPATKIVDQIRAMKENQ